MDGIRATPMQYPILGLLADKLKKAQQFAVAPGGYANPPAEILLNLLGIPAVQQTMERVAYGEPMTTGRGMTTQIRPEVAEAAMTLLPAAASTARVAERGAMAAGRAGERLAERVVPQIMERGGMPAGLLEGMSSRTVSPLDVWHGSPHGPFTNFDPSKVGSGEGTQVFGKGAYLAEARGTGEEYRKRLSDFGSPYTYEYLGETYAPKQEKVFDPIRHAIQLTYHQGKKVAQDIAKSGLADAKKGEAYALEMGGVPYYEQMLNTAKGISKKDIKATQGFLYKVDLPDEQIDKMIKWETPLDEMDEKLASVIKPLQEQLKNQPNPALFKDVKSVGDVIQYANALKLDPHLVLQEAGYPGIKYLDQLSRGKGQGTSNFVVFPEYQDLLTIKEINDKPIRRKQSLLD